MNDKSGRFIGALAVIVVGTCFMVAVVASTISFVRWIL